MQPYLLQSLDPGALVSLTLSMISIFSLSSYFPFAPSTLFTRPFPAHSPRASHRGPHLHPHPQRQKTQVDPGRHGAPPQPAAPSRRRAALTTSLPCPGLTAASAQDTGDAAEGTAVLNAPRSPAGSSNLGEIQAQPEGPLNYAPTRACSAGWSQGQKPSTQSFFSSYPLFLKTH